MPHDVEGASADSGQGTQLINLTPHPVVVRWDDGELELPSQGMVRVSEVTDPDGDVAGVPVVQVRTGGVDGLPEPREGVWLVVSRIVAQALPERDDLLFPYGEIRDAAGRIEAVRGLGRF